MKILLLLFVIVYGHLTILAQNGQAYQLYTGNGKKTSYKKLIKALEDKDVVLFGEYHDNSIVHWLQQEIAKEMYQLKREQLTLAFEMLERDQQGFVDSLIAISDENEIYEYVNQNKSRMWPNFSTDYLPLIEFARNKHLQCIAGNVPRRYASMVYKKGRAHLDSLPLAEKEWIGPLNFKVDTTLSQYAALAAMDMHGGAGSFVDAQAIKDVTMAESIYKLVLDNKSVLHFNGAYHSDFHQGIMYYLQEFKPELKILTISVISQENILSFNRDEDLQRADFIILVPENMTKTH